MTKGSVAVTPQSPTKTQTNAAALLVDDALTPAERETLISEAEWGFRSWLRESGSQSGYVMYPSTRQILKSLQTLYKTIEDVDFSDIAR